VVVEGIVVDHSKEDGKEHQPEVLEDSNHTKGGAEHFRADNEWHATLLDNDVEAK